MKKTLFLLTLLIFSGSMAISQENKNIYLPLLGADAPSFTGESTAGIINFPEDYKGNWTVLFSHPADFTPVCSSELLELGDLQDDFYALGVKLIVLSTDAISSHVQWVSSLETVRYKNREPVKIKFPLVADEKLEISKKYGMIHPNSSSTRDIRGVFVIDPSNKIRAIFFYPMNIGRNMDEIKRTVIALQTADRNDILTPANWKPGEDVLTRLPIDHSEKPVDMDVSELIWYMTFKKLK